MLTGVNPSAIFAERRGRYIPTNEKVDAPHRGEAEATPNGKVHFV